ncbi:REJ domain-containing protein, partial [Baffinella frigidus]
VQKEERFREATVVLKLEDGPVAQVSVDQLSISATRVAFAGASDAEDATFLWDIQGAGIEAEVLSDKAFSPTGDAAATLVVNLRSLPALAVLVPGAVYTISLRATSTTRGQGATSTTFTISLPPSGGSCTATPPEGDAYTGEFTLACSSWASESLPLEYAYGVAASAGDAVFDQDAAAWSPPSYVATFTFILPPGAYAASARVSDSLGSTTLASPSFLAATTPNVNGSTGDEQAEASFQASGDVIRCLFPQAASDAIAKMASLGQSSQILQAAGSIVESLDSARRLLMAPTSGPEAGLSASGPEAGLALGYEAGMGGKGGLGRRLLASSAA